MYIAIVITKFGYSEEVKVKFYHCYVCAIKMIFMQNHTILWIINHRPNYEQSVNIRLFWVSCMQDKER